VDPRTNPYTPGAGSPPHELAGRQPEIEQFEILIARLKSGRSDQSMIIRGLRGVGKTVLLNAFEDIAEDDGFIAFYHEMTPEAQLLKEVTGDLRSALLEMNLGVQALDKLKRGLQALRQLRISYEGFEISLPDSNARAEDDMTSDLSTLFLAVGRAAAKKDTGIVMLFDEAQFVSEAEYRALISALHRATQKRVPVAVVAAGLPQMPKLTGDARSYAERLFSFPVIEALPEEAAIEAFVKPAKDSGVEYTADAIRVAMDWTRGYPFYIQQLGKSCWNIAPDETTRLDKAMVEASFPDAQRALDEGIYDVRLQRASEMEKRYMGAMAELGPGPYRTGDVAKAMGRKTTGVSQIRQGLIAKGLIYSTEEHGQIDFTVPRFSEFMLRVLEGSR